MKCSRHIFPVQSYGGFSTRIWSQRGGTIKQFFFTILYPNNPLQSMSRRQSTMAMALSAPGRSHTSTRNYLPAIIFPSLVDVASGVPCRHRQRQWQGRYLVSQTNRNWQHHRHCPTAKSFNRGFRSSSVAYEDDSSHISQLFHDIASRMEGAESLRSTSNATTQRRKSAASLTSEFCKAYLSIPDERFYSSENGPKLKLFELILHDRYHVDKEAIALAMEKMHPDSLRESDVQRIRKLCTPLYESIFHYILGSSQKDLGVAFLVHLRRDIRDFIHFRKFVQENEVQHDDEQRQLLQMQIAKLSTMERSIQSILTTIFRPGVLNLRRITYEDTPASIIEQIAFKEAVHPLQSLQDLRTRLGPGRRCFAFFHPALPNKPLAFVHATLLQEMPRSMVDLKSASEDAEPQVATFYSITNTEPGLHGVDLGNHLIKSVVQVMQTEFPTVHTFCTLSPIPKFRTWLETKIARYREQLEHKHGEGEHRTGQSQSFVDDGLLTESDLHLLDLLEKVKSPARNTFTQQGSNTCDEVSSSALFEQLQPLLMKLAAHYLTVEKNHQRPLCSVAKFHTRNGAEVYRLNYMADLSQKGMRNSYGIMVNYRYVLDEIEDNSVQNEIYGDVVVKDEVKCWLD